MSARFEVNRSGVVEEDEIYLVEPNQLFVFEFPLEFDKLFINVFCHPENSETEVVVYRDLDKIVLAGGVHPDHSPYDFERFTIENDEPHIFPLDRHAVAIFRHER